MTEKPMKMILTYLKHYKLESILAPAFKMLEVLFDLLVPLVVAQIIDAVSYTHLDVYKRQSSH